MSGLRIVPLPPFDLGGGGGGEGCCIFLFQDFCSEIGVTENPLRSGYALYFEYMYVCHN